jgi:flagellar basal body-associated protein FliL
MFEENDLFDNFISMYTTRMIFILLLVAILLLCASLFLLLVWMPQEESVRETTREEKVVDIPPVQPPSLGTEPDIPVSQLREPEIAPLGSDHGMEFPIMDIE